MQDQKHLQASSLYDLLVAAFQAKDEGYILSTKNLHFPQAFANFYTATMVKGQALPSTSGAEQTPPDNVVTEEQKSKQELEEKFKDQKGAALPRRGRKPNN